MLFFFFERSKAPVNTYVAYACALAVDETGRECNQPMHVKNPLTVLRESPHLNAFQYNLMTIHMILGASP